MGGKHGSRAVAKDWCPDWRGETCIIVGGGPSAKEVPIQEAKGKARCIVVNNGWQLAPWADILYACDERWWREYGQAVNDGDFRGLKIGGQKTSAARGVVDGTVEIVRNYDGIVIHPPGRVGWAGNSGFHAFNLALQFQVARILLVGFDMTTSNGTHWHGDHPAHMGNPRAQGAERWRIALDEAAPAAERLGVEVINCSAVSALTAYPKMSLMEALAC